MEPAEPGVAAYIGRWEPSSVSPQAAAFARDVITRAGPQGRERAKNLLWAAGKLADYAASLGLDLVPGVVLSRAVESDHGDGVGVAGRGVLGLSGGLVLRGVVDGVTVAM